MRHVSILVLILLVAAGAAAQAPKKADDTKPSLWVEVELKNGSTIIGIAKEGVLVERRVRGEFKVAKDKKGRRAGIRVWHPRANGFMFLTYESVAAVKVLGRVMPRDLVRKAKKPAEKKDGEAKDKDGKQGPTGSKGPLVQKIDKDGLTQREHELLVRFDPSQGWTAERYGEIQRRRILEKRKPTAKEEEFCDAFTEWEEALKKLEKAQASKQKKRRR